MSGRCYSTLAPLARDGFSPRARARLADRRRVPHELAITRADLPRLRAETMRRVSISGVQDKLSLDLVRGRFVVVEGGGRYLLKPIPGARLPELHDDLPANEHLTMQLAEQVFGLETAANACVRLADGELAYLTRRFDRRPDGARVAQEDFCQLLERSPDRDGPNYKYDGSYEELGRALRRFCPAYVVEVERLFRRIVFSYAVSNGDAHLKNFSLSQGPRGDFLLSPAYDLVATSLHLPDERRLALGLFDGDEIPRGVASHGFETGADLLDLSRRFGIKEARARRFLDRLAARRDDVHALVERSFLSAEAKRRYRARFDDRLAALALVS